jgi:predicted GIY-YIG superfamily endonuclease
MRQNTPTLCECGITVLKNGFGRHMKSIKHHQAIYNIKENQRLKESGLYKAKLYKIVSNVSNEMYIGSTIQPLYKRMNQHRKRFKHCEQNQYSSSILFKKYGIENCSIVLLKEIEIKNFEEQRKLEREEYDKYKDFCVNLRNPSISPDEIRENRKNWGMNNKQRINENKNRNYRKNNTDKFVCECGTLCNPSEKSRHFKSKKHVAFVK